MDSVTAKLASTIESKTHCSPSVAESIAVGIVAALRDPAIIEKLKEIVKD